MELKFLIDLGNSKLKWALLFREEKNSNQVALNGRVDCETISNANFKKYLKKKLNTCTEQIRTYCKSEYTIKSLTQCAKVYISSVANERMYSIIEKQLKEIFTPKNIHKITVRNNQELLSKSQKNFLFKINRHSPTELGVDRWLAMIGLTEYFELDNFKTAFILAAGTATVMDKIIIRQDKKLDGLTKIIHDGGFIIPGFSLMEKSLSFLTQNTETKIENPFLIPKNTADSVRYGISFSQATLLLLAEKNTPIFLYGGNAEKLISSRNLIKNMFQKETSLIEDPWLVFKGINWIANSQKAKKYFIRR